jgi:hypothetical protein
MDNMALQFKIIVEPQNQNSKLMEDTLPQSKTIQVGKVPSAVL